MTVVSYFLSLLLMWARLGLVNPATTPVTSDLTGNHWTLDDRTFNNVSGVQATVPGQVHVDLLKAGIIKDPYYGYNQQQYQWIANDEWWYNSYFNVSRELYERQYLWLQCDGVDTAATVVINYNNNFYANSQHKRYFFDIRFFIVEGSNNIRVKIQSALKYSDEAKKAYPYDVPTAGSYIVGGSRNFIRKAQSDFGWDWGPAFAPVGIWRYLGLVAFDVGLVTDVAPRVSYSDGVFGVDIWICATIPEKTSLPVRFEASTALAPGQTAGIRRTITQHGELCESLYINIEKPNVKMWYPSGYGEPNLNKIEIKTTITDADGMQNNQTFVKTIGYRYVELVQDDVSDGKTFYFKINGIPVFVKGSNFIPADAFDTRATPNYLRKLLQSAKAANQNMVRVWGGGIYQKDEFYDICDELGIMVWQEFMFAVSLYPRDQDFLDNVRDEVKYNVLRLTNHPSIVLWSGNNENQDLWLTGRYTGDEYCDYATKKGTLYTVDYSVLYDDVVHATLQPLTNIPYWPSSPSNGYLVSDPSRNLFVQRWGESQDTHYGDIHRYDYTDPCTDVSFFPRPRFASEFGLQSYPSITSWLEISDPSMWGNDSPFMNWRQHHPDGNTQMYNQIKYFTRVPNNPNKTRQFEDLVYLTQVVQMVCITAEIEHYRRIRDESYTMGTLYWQLNDIWQAQSWASLEYGGRWKLLHNGVKRAYDKYLISGFLLNNTFSLYMISDNHEANHTTYFEIDVYTWDGKLANKIKDVNISLPTLKSKKVFTESASKVFQGCSSVEDCFLMMSMGDTTGAILAENVFVPSLLKAALNPPKISIGSKQVHETVAIFTVQSDNVAPYVYLYTKVDGYFSDNGFMVLPGRPVTITFLSYETLDQSTFWEVLQVKSIRDTYQ